LHLEELEQARTFIRSLRRVGKIKIDKGLEALGQLAGCLQNHQEAAPAVGRVERLQQPLLQLGPLALPVGRREDKQRLAAAADSALDLVQNRGCRGKVAVVNAHAQTGGFQRRKQLLVNPGAGGARA